MTQTPIACRARGAGFGFSGGPVCLRCGEPAATGSCTACGTVMIFGARFCHACGAAADASAEVPPAPRERKMVTILFADLRGSTGLVAGHDPEQAMAVFSLAIDAMREAVHRFGGTVNRVQGDGLMALFGAPVAQEDHARRACHAALAMCDAVRGVGARLSASAGLTLPENTEFAVRVGLNSGEVVFRTVRTDLAENWDAAGEVVAIAARMEQMAAPGEAWATAATLRLVRGGVTARSLGMLPVKGLSDPIGVFALTTADAWRGRFQVDTERYGLSGYINRRAELATLHAALARARRANGQAVALAGDAGCGKSRLVYEFTSSPRTADCLVLAGACAPFAGASTGYLPLLGITRAIFGLVETDDAAMVRARIQTRLLPSGGGLAATLPAFLALYGLIDGEEAAAWARLEPDERRRRTVEAFLTLTRHEAGGRPAILVVEDLHWVDAETEALLTRILDDLAGSRVLLLMSYRPDYEPGWIGLVSPTQIQVRPLDDRDAARMSRALLGTARAVAPLARLLAERTGGNPLFLEETVSALSEQGVLTGMRGAYRLAPGQSVSGALAMSSTVRTVLAARIDRLPPADKRVLEAAAVIGAEFHPLVIADAAEIPEEVTNDALNRLQRAGFLHDIPQRGDVVSLAFRHALMQEAAYAAILHTRRRAMHARVMMATERLYPDRLTEHAEVLARHAIMGEVWDRAVEHATRAAGKVAARDANRQAVVFYDEALAALTHLPQDDPAVQRQAVDLRFAVRTPLFRMGEIAHTLRRLREAEPQAERLGDTARLGQLAIFISHLSWLAGDHAGAVAEGAHARTIAAERNDIALAARADFQSGLGALGLSEFAEAARLMGATAERALAPEVAGRYGLDAPLAVVALGYRARALTELGAFDLAEAAVDACATLAAQVDRPFSSIFATIAAGHLDLARGRAAEAIPRLARAVTLCHQADAGLMLPVATALLGAAHTASGHVTEGVRHLRSAVTDAERAGCLFLQPQRLTLLAEALLIAGRAGEATRVVARATELATRQGERGPAAAALLVRARLLAAAGQSAQGRVMATEAARAASDLGMRPLAGQAASFAAELSSCHAPA